MASINMKRGDAFGFSNQIFEDDGKTPIIGIASELKSQVRDKNDNLICDLTINESADVPGTYIFKADNFAEWTAGTLYTDIQYTLDGQPKSTPTIAINVERDVTR